MRIELRYSEDEYGERQKIEVLNNGEVIRELSTASDCSEDNTISRLGIADFVASIIKEINPDIEIEFTKGEYYNE